RLLAFPRHTRGTNRRGQGNYSLFNMRADLAKEDSAQVGVLAINLSDGATGVSPVSPGGDARLFTGSTSGTHGSAGKRRSPTAETIFKNTCCTGLAGRVGSPIDSGRPLLLGSRWQRLGKAIADFRERGKFSCHLRPQPLRGKTPAPVPFSAAGYIHARIASEPQRILHRHYAEAGHGAGSSANHRPVDAIVPAVFLFISTQVRFHLLTFVFRCTRFPPAEQRVVVVRSGVDNLLGGESVRQMGMRANVAKAKLQHGHAGNLEPF